MAASSSGRYAEWQSWIKKHHHLMQHPADFEAKFVLNVLVLVPDITTANVVPQYEFTDSMNKKRRIDFVILDESRGMGLAIELDGLSKLEEQDTHCTNYRKFDDLLARQNDLLSMTKGRIFMLFRFSNRRWLEQPEAVAKQISDELKAEMSAYQEMVRQNRLTQNIERNLEIVQEERDNLQQLLKKAEQDLYTERIRSSEILSNGDKFLKEKSKLSIELEQKTRQLDEQLHELENARQEVENAKQRLAQERQRRMREQQERDAMDARRDKDIADLKRRMDKMDDASGKQHQGRISSSIIITIILVCAISILAVMVMGNGNTSDIPKSSSASIPSRTNELPSISSLAETALPQQADTSLPPLSENTPAVHGDIAGPLLETSQAEAYVGRIATVCGTLYEINERGVTTYLNFDAKFPKNIFTVVISDNNANQFLGINNSLGNRICVHGTLRKYGKKIGMELTDKAQLMR